MKKQTFLLVILILSNQVKAADYSSEDPSAKQKVRLDQHFKKIPKHDYTYISVFDESPEAIEARRKQDENNKEAANFNLESNLMNQGSGVIIDAVGAQVGAVLAGKTKGFKQVVAIGATTYLAIDLFGRMYLMVYDLDAGFAPAVGIAGWSLREINEFFTDLPADYADLIKSLKAEHGKNGLADGVTLDDYFKSIDEVERNNGATLTTASAELGVGAVLVYKNFKNKAAADTLFKKAKSWMKIGAGVYAVYDGTSRIIAHIEGLEGGLSPAASMTSYLVGKSKEAAGSTPAPTKQPRKGVIESTIKGALSELPKSFKGDFNK